MSEKYSLEEAQKEAEALRRKVESNRASGYAEAEQQLEKDKETIPLSELETLVKQAGGEIKANNGNVVLAYFQDSEQMKKFADRFVVMDENEIRPELPIACYAKKYSTGKDKQESNESELTVESVLNLVLEGYKSRLRDYMLWLEDLKGRGVDSMTYPDAALKYQVEGGYKNPDGTGSIRSSTGRYSYISPRFSRLFNSSGRFFSLTTAGNRVEESSAVLAGVPIESGRKLDSDFLEWLLISTTFWGLYKKTSSEEGIFDMLIDEIKNTEELKGFGMSLRIGDESEEECKKRVIADIKNYLPFLERAYEEVREFIGRIESLAIDKDEKKDISQIPKEQGTQNGGNFESRNNTDAWKEDRKLSRFPIDDSVFEYVFGYVDRGVLDKDRIEMIPVELKQIVEAFLAEASAEIERIVAPYPVNDLDEAESKDRKNYLAFPEALTHMPVHRLVQLNRVSALKDKLNQIPLFRKYIESLIQAGNAVKWYTLAAEGYRILGNTDEADRYEEINSQYLDLFNARKTEPIRVEDVKKSLRIMHEYVDAFKQSELHGFDTRAYLDDQKRQWQALAGDK